jgi:hypothetical protein
MNETLTTGGYEQTKEKLRDYEAKHAKQNAFTPKK